KGCRQAHRPVPGPHRARAPAGYDPAVTRQRLYRTPAVILKRMDLGEADRIVTLYTRDVGKVRAVAKGVRRAVSRSAGHLEPFTLSDVLFAVGRELDVISQADSLEAFRGVREDLELTTHAYYLAEVVDLLTEDRMENRAVFDVLVDGLHNLGAAAEARLVLIVFQLKLLDALGYRPELRECVSCRAASAQPGAHRPGPGGRPLTRRPRRPHRYTPFRVFDDQLPPASSPSQPHRALYLRWRPRRFEDVVGQEHVTRTLRNAVKLGR